MKGVFVPCSCYGTLHLSENGIFAFRANLAGDLCPLLRWEGFLCFRRTFRGICRQGLYSIIYLFLRISVVIVMKSDQLHLPTGQVKHGQWLQQLCMLRLPFHVLLLSG